MLKFCRRIRYSSRSSGPSKASRKTSSASGGMYRSCGIVEQRLAVQAGHRDRVHGGGRQRGGQIGVGWRRQVAIDHHGGEHHLSWSGRRRAAAARARRATRPAPRGRCAVPQQRTAGALLGLERRLVGLESTDELRHVGQVGLPEQGHGGGPAKSAESGHFSGAPRRPGASARRRARRGAPARRRRGAAHRGQDAAQDLERRRRAAGHGDVDRNHVGDAGRSWRSSRRRCRRCSRSRRSRPRASARASRRRCAQRVLHVARHRPGDQQHVGVARAGDEPDAQPLEVVVRVVERVDLELAAVARAGVDLADRRAPGRGCRAARAGCCSAATRSASSVAGRRLGDDAGAADLAAGSSTC